MSERLLAFLSAAALIVVTPGVDMALVTKNALMRGRGAALATAVGVNAGIVVWIAASALGVAAIVRASAAAFAVLKLAGAVYLMWLGLNLYSMPGGALSPPPACRRGPWSARLRFGSASARDWLATC